jgi:hypothetical protein
MSTHFVAALDATLMDEVWFEEGGIVHMRKSPNSPPYRSEDVAISPAGRVPCTVDGSGLDGGRLSDQIY